MRAREQPRTCDDGCEGEHAQRALAPKPLPAATYTEQILANFGCSHRAAADTIAILKRARLKGADRDSAQLRKS